MRAALAAVVLALAAPAAAQTLTVEGFAGPPRALAVAELGALPRREVVLTEDGGPHRYEGPLLAYVLRQAGLPMGARLHGDPLKAALVVTGADGFQAVYSLAEVDADFHDDVVILADRVDGAPLPAKRAPWRIVSSGDRKGWRAVYAVSKIEVRPLGAPAAAPAAHEGHGDH